MVNFDGKTAHDPYINHCLLFAFDTCNEQHTHICPDCNELFQFFIDIKENTSNDIYEEIHELQEQIFYYLSHQTRKVYLNAQFNANLLDLDEKGAVIIVDYKMKILPKSARETKNAFFEKKGWTLHSTLVYTLKSDYQLDIQVYDH